MFNLNQVAGMGNLLACNCPEDTGGGKMHRPECHVRKFHPA